MSKRKVDEADTTCNTWLTTRNKKQDLKEFKYNLQRLSQQRTNLIKLSRRPVAIVTTRQSKLSDFFQNVNSAGKENDRNQQNDILIPKSNRRIKGQGQPTTINGMWTNIPDNNKSSHCHNNTSIIEDSCGKVIEDCVMNNIEGDIDVSSDINRSKLNDLQHFETGVSSLDTFSLSSNIVIEEEVASFPYLDYSDTFCRNASHQNLGGGDSLQMQEMFEESGNCEMNTNTIMGLRNSESTSEGCDEDDQDVGSFSTIIGETSSVGCEPSIVGVSSCEPYIVGVSSCEPSIVGVLNSDEYSLESLRFTLDSEKQIMKLRESCLPIEDQQLKLSCIDLNEPILTQEADISENDELQTIQTNELESKKLYFEDSQLDFSQDRLDASSSESAFSADEFDSQDDNTIGSFVGQSSHLSESLELVENSHGCLQVKKLKACSHYNDNDRR